MECPQCDCPMEYHEHYATGVLVLSFEESHGMDNEWQKWFECPQCGEKVDA